MLDRAAPHGLREAVARGDAPATRQLLDRIPVDDPEVLDVLARAAADGGVGARLATELLVERLDASGVVRRFVRAALLDEAAVDDVTQDALISVAGSVHSFAGEAKVTTWCTASCATGWSTTCGGSGPRRRCRPTTSPLPSG